MQKRGFENAAVLDGGYDAWQEAKKEVRQAPEIPVNVEVDDPCPTCKGERTIAVPSAEGGQTRIPCPDCAPNDAPGG